MGKNWIMWVCLCLGILCWCAAACCAIRHRKDLKAVIRYTGVGAFASLFFFVYPYGVVQSGFFAIPLALLQVMASAVVASDPLSIFEAVSSAYTVPFLGVYQAILIVLHVIAPLFTIGITLSFFESKFAAILYRLRSGRRESHIFSEVNERTLCLAESIYASDKKSIFVFLGDAAQLDERRELAERIHQVNGTVLDITPGELQHSLKHTRTYYLLGLDSEMYPYTAWVEHYAGDPILVIDDFNELDPQFAHLNQAFLMSFAECDEDCDGTRLFGIPLSDPHEGEEGGLMYSCYFDINPKGGGGNAVSVKQTHDQYGGHNDMTLTMTLKKQQASIKVKEETHTYSDPDGWMESHSSYSMTLHMNKEEATQFFGYQIKSGKEIGSLLGCGSHILKDNDITFLSTQVQGFDPEIMDEALWKILWIFKNDLLPRLGNYCTTVVKSYDEGIRRLLGHYLGAVEDEAHLIIFHRIYFFHADHYDGRIEAAAQKYGWDLQQLAADAAALLEGIEPL